MVLWLQFSQSPHCEWGGREEEYEVTGSMEHQNSIPLTTVPLLSWASAPEQGAYTAHMQAPVPPARTLHIDLSVFHGPIKVLLSLFKHLYKLR